MAQSNSVYDPETDDRSIPHSLSDLENQATGDASDPRGPADPQTSPAGDSSDPRGAGLDDVKNKEGLFNKDGDAGSDKEEGSSESKYNPEGDKNQRFGKARGRLKKAAKNKLLVGGMVAGGGATVVGLILLVLLAGSLKIPNLAQHITEYQFARVLRQSVESENKISYQKLALQSLEDKAYGPVKERYQNVRNDTWGKLDKYRPKQAQKLLGSNNGLEFHTKTTALGREQLVGVSLNNKLYGVTSQKGFTKYIPGISNAIEFGNKVRFAKEFAPALSESIHANKISNVIRGKTEKLARKKAGIGLVAWSVGKYLGKDADQAELALNRETYEREHNPNTEHSLVPTTDETIQAASDSEKASLGSDPELKAAIKNGGVFKKTADVINQKIEGLTAKSVLKTANPAFGVALSACTIYDASLSQSGPTIDAQTQSQQKAYYFLASAGDQQKFGNTNGEAVGATNAKLGDITQSNAEVRASGGTPDTSTALSTQGTATGDASILTVAFGGGIGGIIDSIAKPSCNIALKPAVAYGGAVVLTIGSIIAGLISDGAAPAGEAAIVDAANVAVEQAAKSVTSRLVSHIVEKVGTGAARKEAAGNVSIAVGKTGGSVLAVGGLSVLAKLIVLSKSHILNNGLEQGTDYANAVDSGGNLASNTTEQQHFYGRPLSQPEAGANHVADLAFVSEQNSAKPAFERYFATANANSLLNKTATMSASTLNTSSFFKLVNKLGDPLTSMFHVFSSLISPRSFAAATYSNASVDYGNVQWGYSSEEMNLIRLDDSFTPLDNQKQLDASNNEDAINTKYGKCFDGSLTIGTMLSKEYIVRDKEGNVQNDNDPSDKKSLCAPNNLGPGNSEFGPQMVFRWRLAHNYNTTLDDMLAKQDITEEDTSPATASGTGSQSSGPSGGSGTLPKGSATELAAKLKPFLGKQISCNGGEGKTCSDISNTAEGKSIKGGSGCLVDALDPALLGMLLELVNRGHTFVLSAICSDHGPDSLNEHNGGHAADFNFIDGVFLGAGDTSGAGKLPWNAEKTKAAEALDKDIAAFMPKGTEFGQVGAGRGFPACHVEFSFLSAFPSKYADGCHHQHIRAHS
jgi:hypothetical protein